MRRPWTTLQARLVAASLLAAVVAIVGANTAAYFSLRHTLFQRIDASLQTVQLPKGERDGTGHDGPRRLAETFFFEERDAEGTVLNSVDAIDSVGRAVRPKLPAHLDVLGTSGTPGSSQFFTTPAIGTNTKFRVKVWAFQGDVLILGATLDDLQAPSREHSAHRS